MVDDRQSLWEYLDAAVREYHGRPETRDVIDGVRLSRKRFRELTIGIEAGEWSRSDGHQRWPFGMNMVKPIRDPHLNSREAHFVNHDGDVLHIVPLQGLRWPLTGDRRSRVPDIFDLLSPVGRTRIARLEHSAAWLRSFLAEHGVSPAPTSVFAKQLSALERLPSSVAEGTVPLGESGTCLVRDALGMDFLARALNRAVKRFDFDVEGHASIFRSADLNLLSRGFQSQDRDFGWELLVGSLTATFCEPTTLAEPDVRCSFEGADFGLACKTVYTPESGTATDSIIEGAQQLEDSGADWGVVVVNLSNLVAHVNFLGSQPGVPEGRNFPRLEDAHGELARQIAYTIAEYDTIPFVKRLTEQANGAVRAKTRAVLFVAQSVAMVAHELRPITAMIVFDFRQLQVGSVEVFVDRLLEAAHSVYDWEIRK